MDPQLIAMIAQMAQQQQQNNMAIGQSAGSGGDIYSALGQSGLGTISPGFAMGMGYLSGRKQKKEKKKLKKKIEKQRAITRSIYGKGMAQQEALERQAIQQQLGGFDTAQKAAGMSAGDARRRVLEREQQQLASGSQMLANRGLSGTSRAANLQRGIGYDTNRAMTGIDQGLADYFGQLAMGRAGVEAGGTRSLADLAGQRSNFDIEDSQFWSPYNWQQFGGAQQRLSGMQQPQLQQMDLSGIFGAT